MGGLCVGLAWRGWRGMAAQCSAMSGKVCLARIGGAGIARRGESRLREETRSGARRGRAGMDWNGPDRPGSEWMGKAGMARRCPDRSVRAW